MSNIFSLQPLISVVIVSWNVAALLKKCIESLHSSDGHFNLEIIVVDNNSSDNTIDMVKGYFPGIKLIENRTNVGFARACNQGFRIAMGSYVFILNPDTEVEKNAVSTLLNGLIKSDNIGMTGPRIIYSSGKVQSTCARRLPKLKDIVLVDILKLNKFIDGLNKIYDYDRDGDVEAISGAAMMIRSDVLKGVNYFREDYIHCGEDIELCYQIKKKGFGIKYLHDAVVIHHEGQSSKQDTLRTQINAHISIQRYCLHTQGFISSFIYRFVITCIQMPVVLFNSLARLCTKRISVAEFKYMFKLFCAILKWKPIYRTQQLPNESKT